MSTATHTSRTAEHVEHSLRGLRSKITTWFVVDGLSRLLLCLLMFIVIDMFIDWRFNLDRPQRIAMLILAVVPLGYVAYRYLFKPWFGRLSDDALCLEVEKRNIQLGESLISAIQFSRAQTSGSSPEVKHVSSTMVDATIQEGIASAKDIAFEDILDLSRLRFNGVLLAICSLLLVAGVVSVAISQPMRTWFERNILLQEKEWASHAVFEFVGLDENGELVVPHGSNWPLVIRMIDDNLELPAAVDVDLRVKSGNRTERAERFEQSREFRVMLKRVTSPLEVRARAGRSRTDWYPVRLVIRPTTEKLALEITPPVYSSLPKQKLPEGEGPYYILKGSGLSVTGTSSKPIAMARLVVGDEAHEMVARGENQFHLNLDPKLVAATRYRIELEGHQSVWNPATNEFVPLRSQDGLEFTLKNSPDLAPSVKAELVGIGSMVLPGARIPYTCSIEDDFGVTATRLRFEWRVDSPDAEMQKGTTAIAMSEDSVRATKFSFEDAVNLGELNVTAGSGFAFEIEADDNDDVSGPNVGKSTKFLLRVVGEDELRANLLRREQELRQEFASVLKRQEDILVESEALQAGLREDNKVTPDQRKALMESQRNEKQLTTSLLSIAKRLSSIIVETQNNRIEEAGGPIEQRLGSKIVEPMRQLGNDSLPEITKNLDRVRRQLDEHAERDEALANAIGEQQQAIDSMKHILSMMIKSEGFQEAVNLLHQVQQEQRNVSDLTDREKQSRLERILDNNKD